MTEPNENKLQDAPQVEIRQPASADAACSHDGCAAPNSTVTETSRSTGTSFLIWIWNIPANVAIFLVRIYQWTLSPIIGRQCRFYPSCSQYYILAVKKYGFVSGSVRGFWRICRCNPFCRGGEDFP